MAAKASRERLLFIFLIIGIILLFNFIINKRVLRLDLTQDKRYTVSNSTIDVLRGLDDIINIDVYFSKDLPPQFRNLDEEVRSLLEELRAYSGKNLHIEYYNPKEDPAMEQKLQALQIPKVRANIIEKDRAQVVELYLGIVIYYQDTKEIIPVVQNVSNLEYDIISKIIKVKSDKKYNIKLVYDPSRYQGPDAQMMTHNIVQAMFSENFNYEALPAENAVFDDTDLLLVLPVDEPTDEFLYRLDQYIMKGRSAVFFVSGMKIHQQTMMASPYESRLVDLLSHYGINIDGSLVVDSSNSMASFRTEFGFFSTHYPFWTAVRSENINRENPVTANIEGLILPYVSPVSAGMPEKEDDSGKDKRVLFRSSKISYKKYSPINLSPQQDYQFKKDMTGLIDLAILYEEPLSSFFRDKEHTFDSSGVFFEETPEKSRLAVIGSDHILYDFFLQNNENNIVFLQNLVDWYTLGEALIGIRSKQIIQRPLKELSDTEKTYLKWLAILVIPLLLLIFGLVKYWVKKHSRKLAMQR